jgi:hypothetical protein
MRQWRLGSSGGTTPTLEVQLEKRSQKKAAGEVFTSSLVDLIGLF